jgi:hypothetical protein
MTGRTPPDAATVAELLAARDARDTTIANAEEHLLALVDEAVGMGAITIGAAAAAVGSSRVSLSRALNARGSTGRRGGGRAGEPDAEAMQRLTDAALVRDETVQHARTAFAEHLAAVVNARRITVTAAAEVLGVHRNTLINALEGRTALRRL